MTLKERVNLGAKLLDDIHGKWAHMIPIKSFVMSETCSCVLHHVYGGYCKGIGILGVNLTDVEGCDKDRNHGFDCSNSDDDYDEWESYWVDEIQLRLNNDQPTEGDENF